MCPDEVSKLMACVASLQGLPCWHAYVSAGNSPGVSMGQKIRREVPRPHPEALKRIGIPDDNIYHEFRDEVRLIAWCPWRLDAKQRPVTSGDDQVHSAEAGIRSLIGTVVVKAEVAAPGWDLQVLFSNELCLRIFSEYVPGKPSFDGNWELRIGDEHIMVGPGSAIRVHAGNRI